MAGQATQLPATFQVAFAEAQRENMFKKVRVFAAAPLRWKFEDCHCLRERRAWKKIRIRFSRLKNPGVPFLVAPHADVFGERWRQFARVDNGGLADAFHMRAAWSMTAFASDAQVVLRNTGRRAAMTRHANSKNRAAEALVVLIVTRRKSQTSSCLIHSFPSVRAAT